MDEGSSLFDSEDSANSSDSEYSILHFPNLLAVAVVKNGGGDGGDDFWQTWQFHRFPLPVVSGSSLCLREERAEKEPPP
ncbi:MAG: hypothetical protein H0X30_29250 [Anaerolineae bacterium]|nr:hypothetical protein [Anaerolineae bacterium]